MKVLLSILKLYWRYSPAWFMAGLAIAILTALASITLLATAGWFLGATALFGATALGSTVVFNTIYPGFLIRTAALTRTVSRYAERVVSHDATFRFLARLRLYVFDGIARLPFRRLRDFRSGELLARLTADIDALDGIYLRILLPLATALLASLGLIVVLHGINVPLALVSGGILLLSGILLPWQAGKVGVRLGRRIAFASEALRLRYIDLLRGQVELIMAGRLGDQQASVASAAARMRDLQTELAEHDLRGRALISLAGGAALVSTLLIGAAAFEADALSGPLVLLAVLAVFAMTELLAPIRRGLLDIGKAIYAGQRILPLLGEPLDDSDRNGVDHGPVRLEIERIDFAYSDHAQPILQDFSLSLRSGDSIGIVGGSGAGKSTLLSLVSSLLEPQEGRIRFEYEDGRAAHFAPRIGLLTQRTELFRESLGFNLSIGNAKADADTLIDVMHRSGLEAVLNRLPSGLDQMLGDEGQGLSGGESRRMALARLLLFNPDLWLLDEATEGLDGATAKLVLTTLREATRGKALLFVTHKKAEASLADRLLVLREGEAPRLVDRSDEEAWNEEMARLR